MDDGWSRHGPGKSPALFGPLAENLGGKIQKRLLRAPRSLVESFAKKGRPKPP
jgi:hypothetical protein